MDIRIFLARHPVFTRDEIESALAADYSTDHGTANARLAYHVRAGHVIQLQRGLYASVPAGTDPTSFMPDPWLVASRLANDSVIAYRSAFQFYGRAYSVSDEVVFFSKSAIKAKELRGYRFRRVPYPVALERENRPQFGVEVVDRQGLDVRVTSLERALVDLLDRPDLGGGWEEIWRALESVDYYEVAQIVDYALLLDSASTAAKVGFFLEQHRNTLMVEEFQLMRLKQFRPSQPRYMQPGTSGRLVHDWNLIIPQSILDRSWEVEV